MKFLSFLPFMAFAFAANAQVFWTEDFGTGCSQGNSAGGYNGANGTWIVTSTGSNDTYANQWFVSATGAGTGVGNCGGNCLNNAAQTNRSLHVGALEIPGLVTSDEAASYNSGGICDFGFCVATSRRAESPAINCTGKTGITLAFNYFENGDGTSDDASLWFYDGSTWSLLQNLAKTPLGICGDDGQWTAYSVELPAAANNNPNVKIGFNWVNNDDGLGTDPSFAVDDITLSTVAGACGVELSGTHLSCFGECDGTATASADGVAPIAYTWTNGASSELATGLCAGTYSVTIADANGCSATASVTITEPTELVVTDTVLSNSCSGCLNGEAELNANGGTAPYTFAWSNGTTDALNDNLNPGVYAYSVTDANGCQVVDSVTIDILENVNENLNTVKASVYPNPTTGYATLTVTGPTNGTLHLVLTDALGRSMQTVAVQNGKATFGGEQLASGSYQWQLVNALKQTVSRGRLVIH